MIISLTEAQKNTFWKVVKIPESPLKNQLQKVGVNIGTILMPLEHIEKTLPVRMQIIGQKKDILISPDMTIHMVVHSTDNKKISLAEIPAGSNAHLEGVTGGSENLVSDLEKLGIRIGETDFKILRRLPPMSYFASNEQGEQLALTENMASKILGEMDSETVQFSMSGKGRNFKIVALLGSKQNQDELAALGVHVGQQLVLDYVEPCSCTTPNCCQQEKTIRLVTKDNMQFYLALNAARDLLVSD